MNFFRPRVFIITGLIFLSAGLGFRIFIIEQADRNSTLNDPLQIQVQSLLTDIKGTIRPEFLLPDIHGQIRSIKEWDGKVVLINFWATWCLPCLKEIPELIALQNQYGDKGLQVIGIALQNPKEVIDFVAKHNMSYPVLAGEAEVIVIAQSYGNHIGALPYTAIIDRRGIVSFTKAGPVTFEEAEEVIVKMIM